MNNNRYLQKIQNKKTKLNKNNNKANKMLKKLYFKINWNILRVNKKDFQRY